MKTNALLAFLTAVFILPLTSAHGATKTAIFAGGCFWCVEKDFEHVAGVISAESGYTGGSLQAPTYKTYGKGGHIEAVRIRYDVEKTSYGNLLHTFWRTVNPTDAGGQFCDRGRSYSTAIFAVDEDQKMEALTSKQELVASGILKKSVVTPIIDATKFWPAEKYHQDYYKKSPVRYGYYRLRCGRDKTIKKLWGKQAFSGVNY